MSYYSPITTDMVKVLETFPESFVVFSPELFILTVSNKFQHSFGLNRDDLIDKHFSEVFTCHDNSNINSYFSKIEASLLKAVNTKKPCPMDQIVLHAKQGENPGKEVIARYWNPVNTPVLDEKDNVLYVIHKVTEVTETEELKRRNDQLNKDLIHSLEEKEFQLEKLYSMFMEAPIGVGIYRGKDFVIEFINHKMSEITGKTAKEVIGKTAFEAYPQVRGQGFEEILEKVYDSSKTLEVNEIEINAEVDGKRITRYYNLVYQPFLKGNTTVKKFIIVLSDVTEQVMSRQKVEKSERQLRLVTDSLPVLICYLNREERYKFVNRAYEAWYGKKPEDIIGKTVKDIIGTENYQVIQGYFKNAVAGEKITFEVRLPYPKELMRDVRVTMVPDIQHGEVVGFFTLVTDVSDMVKIKERIEIREMEAQALAVELKKSNNVLEQTNQQLSNINSDLDNFIYTASHDLQAPIANIEGLMHSLKRNLSKDSFEKPVTQKLFNLITKSVERFKKTLDELANITKIQREEISKERVPIDLKQITQEVILDLNYLIEENDVLINTDLNQCQSVQFHPKNARSIVYNLISNAIKYRAPDRSALIKIRCFKNNQYIVFEVQDNGLGMDTSDESKIFGMFSRLHDHVEGTGVGLYIVKKIIENEQGRITVKSEVGVGTTFQVHFNLQNKPL